MGDPSIISKSAFSLRRREYERLLSQKSSHQRERKEHRKMSGCWRRERFTSGPRNPRISSTIQLGSCRDLAKTGRQGKEGSSPKVPTQLVPGCMGRIRMHVWRGMDRKPTLS